MITWNSISRKQKVPDSFIQQIQKFRTYITVPTNDNDRILVPREVNDKYNTNEKISTKDIFILPAPEDAKIDEMYYISFNNGEIFYRKFSEAN